MAGMSWTKLATLGTVRFRGFGLGAVHPDCDSVPARFLTFWKRVLTLSSSGGSAKLAGSSSPAEMISFAR